MDRIYIFFLIVFGFCACGRGRYYNKSLWLIPAEFDYYRLKDSPRTVTEYLYDLRTDSGAIRKGQYYQVYNFNRQGNITDRRLFVNGKSVMILLTTFEEGGYLMKMVDSRAGFTDTLLEGSRPVGNGWFKSFSNKVTGKGMTFLTRFYREGEEQLVKVYKDSAVTGEPVQKIITYYKGQRLLKAIVSSPDALLEQRYFYGAGQGPDSVEWLTGGRVAERELFVNNQQGDPSSFVNLKDRDTLAYEIFSYRYDAKGNWVWRRDSVAKATPLNSDDPVLKGNVKITEREIVY